MENRIIKFRAWDGKRIISAEEMGTDELSLSTNGRGFFNPSGVSPKLSEYYNHMIPMQFTGLLDKNGEEIYEGDILEYVSTNKDEERKYHLRIVQWNPKYGCWRFAKYDNRGHIYQDALTHSVKYGVAHLHVVVGNIYENNDVLT